MPERRSDVGAARGGPNAPKHRRVLLVVDDDPTVRQSLASTLSREKYVVHTASDGEEALRLLASTKCDVIVSDLTMPGLSGTQLVDALAHASRDASLIVISGNGSAAALHARLPGVAAYLVKPLRRRVLLEAVANALA